MNFSVLMSVYAKENARYLEECLNSLAKQTLQANEVILVEDGLITTDLSEIIKQYRNELNIISVRIPKNVGLAMALNTGLKNCSYNLIARMDTDDIALPIRFEKQIDFIKKNPDVDIVGSFAIEIDEHGAHGNTRKTTVNHDQIHKNLFTCPFIHPTILFKKDKITALGGYNTKLKRRQDYELWFRCAQAGAKFANIPESLLLYRFTTQTHKRQNLKTCIEQGNIGYNGVKSLKQPLWQGIACYIPILRAILPHKIQHIIYPILKKFDPRQKEYS
ncbi:glycosyltransferase [Thiothrix nivea]|uniref:Glycosyl transferase family 2 n=1 Tax=Thiothrix nivea (strain ATCC 35100 / DSM 5205 / JP2) TaxID=870187 RepID=A0A656HCX6_THINJ|nr:glycosyltransferase [Thiothrix nivea]EIJ34223.1 glycosyl transferase family 2 [Thiothrix nivea DSM 5205]